MADLNRTAKPVALWTTYDLDAFNIKITVECDFQAFFGVPGLAMPQNISPVLWSDVRAPAGPLSKTEKTFFAYMEDALRTPPGEGSLVGDFTLFLLGLFDYDAGLNRVLHSQQNLSLPICGSEVHAKSDGAVVERVGSQLYYILLVQEDTHLYDNGGYEPEAELVAQAIAAFRRNNVARDLEGLPVLDSQTFPAIIMLCTAPAFYFVTITKAFADAVQAGIYPEETTIVQKFLPPVAAHSVDCMLSLQNRRVLFGCFEAFKHSLSSGIEALAQSKTAKISRESVKGPKNVIAVKVSDPCWDALVEVGSSVKTRIQQTANTVAGTKVHPSLVGKNDQEGSNVITVGDSSNALCLSSTGAVSAPAMTGAGSTHFATPGAISPCLTAGSETLWTMHDLQAFNIKITAEHDFQTFFGVPDLPVPQNIPPAIWNNVREPAGPLSKTEKAFFAYLEDTLLTPQGAGPHAVDFVHFLLQLFGYDDALNCVLHSHKDIWFTVSGSRAYAKTDVAVIQRLSRKLYYVLLVQENTNFDMGGCDPEAQLVAQAVAAFDRNRSARDRHCLPAMDSQTFPAIVMTCTTPTFYLITVTDALSTAVEAGIRCQESTIVRKFVPPVDRAGDSMLSLENRKLLFGYLEAFRRLVRYLALAFRLLTGH